MLIFCLKLKKKKKITQNVKSKLLKTKNDTTMILSNCAVHSSKKLLFMKEKKPKGILPGLSLKTPLNKIPLLGKILF